VLDVSMPGLDGLELCRLRADRETSGIRVVLLPAKAQERDIERGFQAGPMPTEEAV